MIITITVQDAEIVTKEKKDGSGTWKQQVVTDTSGKKYYLYFGKFDKEILSGSKIELLEYEEEYNGKMYTKHKLSGKNDKMQIEIDDLKTRVSALEAFRS